MDGPAKLCGPKIFCIGAGKTGTTSLESLFKSLGFHVGDQERGELLLKEWATRNFAPIVSLGASAQFFQDMPFNCPFTFQAMDMAFPNSKFILSVRDDGEQWFGSLIRFHTKLIGKGRLPTAEDLRVFPYRYAGWILEALKLVYGVTDEEPYRKETLITAYERHNDEVKRYFRYRSESLLVINISDKGAAERIIEFVGLDYHDELMPHLNRSDDNV
ncbi:MAG TPA: sulfotransferase [Pyrinomonadaceae bacterium]